MKFIVLNKEHNVDQISYSNENVSHFNCDLNITDDLDELSVYLNSNNIKVKFI